VFFTPPWPEIYVRDLERRHSFDEVVAEYDRLSEVYPSLRYEVVTLPKVSVTQRADLIMSAPNS
jgi:predicted ATPase